VDGQWSVGSRRFSGIRNIHLGLIFRFDLERPLGMSILETELRRLCTQRSIFCNVLLSNKLHHEVESWFVPERNPIVQSVRYAWNAAQEILTKHQK
jgi:hypothetical protein